MTPQDKQEIKEVLKTAFEDANFIRRLAITHKLGKIKTSCEEQMIRIENALKLLDK